MNQRALAAVLAMPLVAALAVVALFKPLPYTTYAPGPTIDVLGAPDGKEIIQVPDGQKTYRDDGQLRMTTVSVTPKDSNLNLFQVMAAWLDRDDAVYPKEAVYPDDKTPDQVRDEGQVQMVSSQDTAVAVALRALGETVTPSLEVTLIGPGSPADGALAVRDLIRKVNGTPLSDDIGKASDELRAAIKSTPPGEQVTLTVLRDGKEVDVQVTPEERSTDLFGAVTVTGSPQIGILLGQGFILPFPVTVTIDPRIGGPSAGLMFSLAIYDTLTPGSLTGGGRVAGTGEIAAGRHRRRDRRHPAEDRRRPRGRRRAVPRPRRQLRGRQGRPQRRHAAGQGRHLRHREVRHRGLGRGPRRQAPELLMSDLPSLDPHVDPALAAAVLEIESHIADGGWDQPSRLYALVDTAALVRREPALASAMGLDDASAAGSLTPVEQEQLPARPVRVRARLDRVGPRGDRLRGRGRAAGAAAGRRRRDPRRPGRRRGVRLRAPGPAGGPDGRGRHPGRGDVLCPAAARARRRPVGGGRRGPGPRADHPAGCHAGADRRRLRTTR